MPEPHSFPGTDRLLIRRAVESDAGLYQRLWSDPGVMANVGFPEGLRISLEEIRGRLSGQGEGVLDRLLVIEEKVSGSVIGECMMHSPDGRGIACTDIKLLPDFQGRGYGTEIKRAMLAFLFSRTECSAVEATPNVGNEASIRMQEAVGGVRTGEGVFEFPSGGREVTRAVHHYVYRVTREAWERHGARPGGVEV